MLAILRQTIAMGEKCWDIDNVDKNNWFLETPI
jgi:hypothetical protein